MESLQEDPILKYNSDTLQYVRKQCNLDNPEEIDKAIDSILEWLKKEDHIMKKDFNRDYIERIIIKCKGSVEKSKQRIDKICTCRLLYPKFFSNFDVNELTGLDNVYSVILPNLTKNHYRVFISSFVNKESVATSQSFTNYYLRVMHISEYISWRDYSDGGIIIWDLRKAHAIEQIMKSNLLELQQAFNVFKNHYFIKLKALHIISNSKWLDAFLTLMKPMFMDKMLKEERLQIHKDLDTLYEYMDKDLLPVDFGGKEKSLKELQDDWKKALQSKEYVDHLKDMQNAKTDESRRQKDSFNEQYLGMPGTFRTLSVD